MTANSSVAASSVKAPAIPTIPTIHPVKARAEATGPLVTKDSAYLFAPSGPPPEEVNRKNLEADAGPNAGKLFLRSVPGRAEVFVNGKIVGQTPLLLVVAPGKYQIEMRGPRQASGKRTIGLMPKEMQTVAITLREEYPSTVRAF